MSPSDGRDLRHEGSVVVDVRGAVASIRFSHPKSNSLPSALLRRLADEIRRVGDSSGVKAIVVGSEGSGPFCAGASFDEMKAVQDAPGGRDFFLGFAKVILAMIRAPQLVVTRVQGKATGGAVGLIAASDYSVATRTASLKLSELAVGLGPFVIGPVVERKVGHGAFASLSIDADWRDAEWGERHGLYSRVFDEATEMDGAVDKLCAFLSQANTEAIRRLKRALWSGTEDWEQVLEQRAAISGALVLSAETRQAIERFAKR